MKQLLLLVAFSLFFTSIIAQTCADEPCTSISNSVLEQRLVSMGIDSNGITGNILNSDTVNVTSLNLSSPSGTIDAEKLSSLDDIGVFSDLIELNVENNKIVFTGWLDDLENLEVLNINNNSVSFITIAFHESLRELYCSNNAISTFGIFPDNLEILECSFNDLSSLNIYSLKRLVCNDNSISELTISVVDYFLEYLDCANNQIPALELSVYPLTYLNCKNNALQNLDVSFKNFNFIDFSNNKNTLEFLNISNTNINSISHENGILKSFKANDCLNLTDLLLTNNEIATFEIMNSPNLTSLKISENQLTELDVSSNVSLEILDCYSNQLSSLNTSFNPELLNLNCSVNVLSNLNTSSNPELLNLYCSVNVLSSLITSSNPELLDLICVGNQITSLDLSNNTLLENLQVTSNDHTTPDTYLQSLNISNTKLSGLEADNGTSDSPVRLLSLNSLIANDCSNIEELRIESDNFQSIQVQNCPNLLDLYLSSYDVIGGPVGGNVGGNLNLSNLPTLKQLTCSALGLTDLALSSFSDLEYLDCYGNLLTEIDASNNNNLIDLRFFNNENLEVLNVSNTQLTTIRMVNIDFPNLITVNASNCSELTSFSKYNSQFDTTPSYLENIDLNNCPNLEQVGVGYNNLSSLELLNSDAVQTIYLPNNNFSNLDLSNKPNLIGLDCSGNQLTTLNIKNGNNTNITSLVAWGNPSLSCIQVDDPIYAYASSWSKDTTTSYSSNCGNSSDHPDYDALVALYNSLNGDNWLNNTNWLSNKPINTWHGVLTLTGDGNSRVTAINLNNNNLTGIIPDEIGDMTNLFNFYFSNNNLSGNLPSTIENLTLMSGFNVNNNNLSGELPDISNISNFQFLNIAGNKFLFADLENQFTNYQNKMAGNFIYAPQKLVGEPYSAAVEIGNSTTLNTNVSGAQNSYNWYRINADGSEGGLIGTDETINITINAADDYKWFYFYEVTSTLVPGLTLRSEYFTLADLPSNHPDYDALIAIYNAFDGANWTYPWNISKPIHNWTTNGIGFDPITDRVTSLSFSGEKSITGTIPPEIGDLTELTFLDFFQQDISGEIPIELWNLTKLKTLFLGAQESKQLQLSSGIPPEIANLQNLEWLNLTQIPLTQPLHPELFNLPNLIRLRIVECGLTGTLPYGLASISDVLASGNEFEGAIPQEFLDAVGDNRLQIQNNYFNFSDLEPIVTANNYTFLGYSPQRTKDVAQTIESAPGTDIELNIDDTSLNKTTSSKGIGDEYQWYKDNVAINGADQISYIITNAQESDSGVYYCQITNPLLPSLVINRDNISLLIDAALSKEEIVKNEISIFPNPTKTTLNIKLNNHTKADVKMYDISGRLIFEHKINSKISVINTSNINSGIYLLQIITENSTITKRIVKK